jgi:hypothetical protein
MEVAFNPTSPPSSQFNIAEYFANGIVSLLETSQLTNTRQKLGYFSWQKVVPNIPNVHLQSSHGVFVKLVLLVTVPPGVVTAIFAVIAPVGTVAVILVAEFTV